MLVVNDDERRIRYSHMPVGPDQLTMTRFSETAGLSRSCLEAHFQDMEYIIEDSAY
jgi:hypothetical protein